MIFFSMKELELRYMNSIFVLLAFIFCLLCDCLKVFFNFKLFKEFLLFDSFFPIF